MGRGFESLQAYHSFQALPHSFRFSLLSPVAPGLRIVADLLGYSARRSTRCCPLRPDGRTRPRSLELKNAPTDLGRRRAGSHGKFFLPWVLYWKKQKPTAPKSCRGYQLRAWRTAFLVLEIRSRTPIYGLAAHCQDQFAWQLRASIPETCVLSCRGSRSTLLPQEPRTFRRQHTPDIRTASGLQKTSCNR